MARAELPETGERFEGLLPPVVAAPVFVPASPLAPPSSLGEYVAAGILTAGQAAALRAAVTSRSNIPVVGGASTGKTFQMFMARPRGFEPLTPRSVVWCSIQLSYGRREAAGV